MNGAAVQDGRGQTVKAAAPFKEYEMSKSKPEKLGPCNPQCPEWRRCKAGRLWVDGPLPCETLLKWEVENEFDRDSSPSYWVMPLVVRVAVEAMG